MPAISKVLGPESTAHQIITRAPPPSQLLSANAIKAVLSDALLSFSPLATLVGADSARALADRVTNLKQSFAASVAPVGALGMMATVAKGSSLTGVKEMLGVGGQDIKDAARALGCAAIAGDVIPRMDENGSMVSVGTGYTLEQAACAIVRQKWQTSSVGPAESATGACNFRGPHDVRPSNLGDSLTRENHEDYTPSSRCSVVPVLWP
jgi:hypothetical protein